MHIHKEGYKIILVSFLLFGGISFLSGYLTGYNGIIFILFQLFCLVMMILVVQFFRVPHRNFVSSSSALVCPADGKLVVIEKIIEKEYFNDERIQVSIFMSPLNVHVNWYPTHGKVVYVKYHPGKYLVAWDPKSSTENERTTVVVDNGTDKIMIRQIAGAVARRIVCYAKEGQEVSQGEEMGFIKFGSRVDMILPAHYKVKAELDSAVQGLLTTLVS